MGMEASVSSNGRVRRVADGLDKYPSLFERVAGKFEIEARNIGQVMRPAADEGGCQDDEHSQRSQTIQLQRAQEQNAMRD